VWPPAIARPRPEANNGDNVAERSCGARDMPLDTVLFLCTGNYYRSRFAEHLFNWLAERSRLRWRAQSRGLAVGTAGNIGPISALAVERLQAQGIWLDGDCRPPLQVAQADLQGARLVIALKEAEHRTMLTEQFPAWAGTVAYWHIDDLDSAAPEDALTHLESEVQALVSRLAEAGSPPGGLRIAGLGESPRRG
jgi:protein-tyrosine phosphatase